MKNRSLLVSICLITIMPIILRIMFEAPTKLAAIPYLAYQLYYMPLGLILNAPFFGHDDELGILVLPCGAIATALLYALIVVFINNSVVRLRAWSNARVS